MKKGGYEIHIMSNKVLTKGFRTIKKYQVMIFLSSRRLDSTGIYRKT